MFLQAVFFIAAMAFLAFSVWNRRRNLQAAAADNTPERQEVARFRRIYLIGYTCASFADWMKGPYVYRVYAERGFGDRDIATLFLAGYASAGLLGPVAGALGDTIGRQKVCLSYFVALAASSLCMLDESYEVLLVGRLLSGLGTALLQTAFESWLICEHHSRGLPEAALKDIFSSSTMVNGAAAVVAGLVSQGAYSIWGLQGPFLVSLVPMAAGWWWTATFWKHLEASEEAPQSDASSFAAESGRAQAAVGGLLGRLGEALNSLAREPRLCLLGLCQALFGGSMYAFVYLWSPAVAAGLGEEEARNLPSGIIFAIFMMMVLFGAMVFRGLNGACSDALFSWIPLALYLGAALAMAGARWLLGSPWAVMAACAAFELCCGLFFPLASSLRSQHLDDATRTTTANLFRVPLNAFVIAFFLAKPSLSVEQSFLICAGANVLAAVCWGLFQATEPPPATNAAASEGDSPRAAEAASGEAAQPSEKRVRQRRVQ